MKGSLEQILDGPRFHAYIVQSSHAHKNCRVLSANREEIKNMYDKKRKNKYNC